MNPVWGEGGSIVTYHLDQKCFGPLIIIIIINNINYYYRHLNYRFVNLNGIAPTASL